MSPDATTLPIPRVGKGPRLRAWALYVVFVAIVSFFVFGMLVNVDVFDVGTPNEYYGTAAAVFAILLVPFLKIFSRRSRIGVVTQLRQAQVGHRKDPKIGWGFDLQPCDRSWTPLLDRRGFVSPRIEVTYRSARVHGDQIEEGSRAVVVGRATRDGIKARQIFNLTPSSAFGGAAGAVRVYGRVTDLQQPMQVADTRYAESHFLNVHSFRIQRTDARFAQALRDERGTMLPPLPVEIRAREVTGVPNEGDRVEVVGEMVAGRLQSKEVYNHSAGGAAVNVKGWTRVIV